MGRVVNAIFANNPLYGLVSGGGKGLVKALVNDLKIGAAYLTGGAPAAVLAAAANSISAYQNGAKAQPPDTTVSSIKTPIPPRVYAYGRSRLYPASVLFETASDGTAVDVYAFADGRADGIEQAYLNDDKVTISGGVVQALPDKKYQGGNVKAGWNLGLATETAFASVMAKLPGIWTTAHRGDGVITGYLLKNPEKEKYYLETYPQGDSVQMSLVGRWQLCFDPRSGQTVWTENPILQLMHYLTVRRKYSYTARILPTLQYWIDAANLCDQQVPLKVGGSENRYRSCVTYDSRAQPKEVIASFLETCDGWLASRGDGALIVYAGKLYTPTVVIGSDDILSYNFQTNIEDENRVDQLTVSYVSAAHDYNVVECTPWGGENGARRTDAISPQSPSFSQNRRLAKRSLARTNAPKRGNCVTNLGGRKARGQRYIYLDLAEDGFDPFEGILPIVEIASMQRDFQAGGLSFDWVVTDPNVDAWNPATEEGLPAALGDNVTPEALAPPTISSITPTYGQNTAYNTPGVKLTIIANGPDRSDLTWYVRTKPTANSVWLEQPYPDIDPSPSVTLETDFLPLGELDVEVSYQVGDGRVSPWASLGPVNTDTQVPGTVTNLSASGTSPIFVDWTAAVYANSYLVEVIVEE